jgi:hypothetical protein
MAYNQERVNNKVEVYTSFHCYLGIYAYHVVSFGLWNAPSVFQKMHDLSKQILRQGKTIYLDDFFIVSMNAKDHYKKFDRVLKALIRSKKGGKKDKCKFMRKEEDYLE